MNSGKIQLTKASGSAIRQSLGVTASEMKVAAKVAHGVVRKKAAAKRATAKPSHASRAAKRS